MFKHHDIQPVIITGLLKQIVFIAWVLLNSVITEFIIVHDNKK